MYVAKCVMCIGENKQVPIMCTTIGNKPCLAILPKIAMRKLNLINLTKKYNYLIPINAEELDVEFINTMKKIYKDLKEKGANHGKS